MKRAKTVLLVGLFGAFIVWCADSSALELVRQWDRVYFERPGTADMFMGLTQDPDGSLVASGRVYTGTGIGSFVVKTDANGKTLWQRSLYYGDDPTRSGRTGHIDRTSDGGYVIGVELFNGPLGSSDGLVFKIDANGNKLWETVFGTAGAEDGRWVAATPDGGCVVAGFSTGGPGAFNDVLVARIDGNGALLWQRFFNSVGFPGGIDSWEGAVDVAVTADGGYVVTGMTWSRASTAMPYTNRPFLIRLDPNGNLLWQKTYDIPGQSLAVQVAANGDLIFAGRSTQGASGGADGLICRTDPNGNIRWWQTYGGNGFDNFLGLTEMSNGDLAAVGWYVGTGPTGTPEEVEWLVVTDASGNLVAQDIRMRDTARFDDAFQVVETPDGGLVVAAQIDAVPTPPGGGDWDAHLAKFRLLPSPARISGTLWHDPAGDCTATGSGLGLAGRLVRLTDVNSGATFEVGTDSAGTYDAVVAPGTYDIAPVYDKATKLTCASALATRRISATEAQIVGGQDVHAAAPGCAASLTLVGSAPPDPNATGLPVYDACASTGLVQTTPCVGYPWTYCMTITNNGTTPWGPGDATLGLYTYPNSSGLNRSGHTVESVQCTGGGGWQEVGLFGGYLYQLQNTGTIAPGESCTVCVSVVIDQPLNPGDNYFTAAVLQVGGSTGCTLSAFDTATETDSCSCDPNDMTVWPQGCGLEGAIAPQRLTYRVRFENVGVGPAHTVVVRNPLDPGLDRSTLRIVEASHPISRVQIDSEGVLTVRFDGIELPAPDPATPDINKGHVTYTIEPKAGLADGTVIENAASIFFDANPQVDTNVVVNTVYTSGSVIPDPSFAVISNGGLYDFAYTGQSAGVSFAWDFGPDASPSTSNLANPSGVDMGGGSIVRLVVTRGGCSAAAVRSLTSLPCERYGISALYPPMGKRKKLGRNLPVKFDLSFDDQPITSQQQLDDVLLAAGMEPTCPEILVYDVSGEVYVNLEDAPEDATDTDDSDVADNPGRCFVYATDDGDGGDSDSDSGDSGEGHWLFNLRLDPSLFAKDRTYEVRVRIGACILVPDNNRFQTR